MDSGTSQQQRIAGPSAEAAVVDVSEDSDTSPTSASCDADDTDGLHIDELVFDQLTGMLTRACEELMNEPDTVAASREIQLPSSLSMSQVDYVLQLLSQKPNIQVDMKWFYPMFSIVIKKRPSNLPKGPISPDPFRLSKVIPATTSSSSSFTILLSVPPQLRDQLIKLSLARMKRSSPTSSLNSLGSNANNPVDSFQSNFNIITYINTEPLVPSKFAPKCDAPRHHSPAPSSMVNAGGDPASSFNSTVYYGQYQQQPSSSQQQEATFAQISAVDQQLLDRLSPVNQLHILTGLSKVDKLNLALLFNNEAFVEQKPCRIIYLQSMSILTFWMALTVKELCGDYHWNSSGYQITLESKSSPNNNIIFFELATFMAALNHGIETSLVTHLIVDIDHSHYFFNLFLLYLRDNFDLFRHVQLMIFARSRAQASRLVGYFAAEQVNLLDCVEFNQQVDVAEDFYSSPSLNWESHPSNSSLPPPVPESIDIVHLYWEDISKFNMDLMGSSSAESSTPSFNAEMEHVMMEIYTGASKVPIAIMIEFISRFTALINYQCSQLGGITPLILTILRGTLDEVARCLSVGANAHLAASQSGLEPIEWAIRIHREDVFHLLFVHLYATNESFDLNLRRHYAGRFMAAALESSAADPSTISSDPVTTLTAQARTSPLSRSLSTPGTVSPPLYEINYTLILRLLQGMIRNINETSLPSPQGTAPQPKGSILILLPSYNKISILRKYMIAQLSTLVDHPFTIFCLYPHLPNNELDIAVGLFNSLHDQVRVILSTFDLDSVLLRDIRYVINTGVRLEKVQSAFAPVSLSRLVANSSADKLAEYRHYSSLFDRTSSKIYFYNLYSKHDVLAQPSESSEASSAALESELNSGEPLALMTNTSNAETDSIYHCIFASKCIKLNGATGSIEQLFNQMINRPPKYIVDNALSYLKGHNILDDRENFTELGRILIDLSIEPHYAKMIIYSILLRCLDPILTIVCALASPNCFEFSATNAENRAEEMEKDLAVLSHGSYSDHLTYVYAFQKWQELCRSNPKNVGYDKSGVILFSSFELIYSLRTKLLGQLRACGFVRGKGPLNIRQLNTNSDNFTLVKAAICAGQSADSFALMEPASSRLIHGNSESSGIAYLHPNSVLAFHQQQLHGGEISRQQPGVPSLTGNLVMFDSRVTCGTISYLINCTLINPLTVAIFADDAAHKSGLISLSQDGETIQFDGPGGLKMSGRDGLAGRVFELRLRWQHYVRRRLANLNAPGTDEERTLVVDMIRLCSLSDEYAAFVAHPNIGRAPQVMSTYFCSTKMVAPKSG